MTMVIRSHSSGSWLGAELSPNAILASETERTVSTARVCGSCGTTLTGRRRQAQFCSDGCRMRGRRASKTSRRRALLRRLKEAVAEIELELTGDEEALSHATNYEPRP